ncbi:MAG: hypothetical protein ACTHOD_01500 [Motilibacteraceae bacterium]
MLALGACGPGTSPPGELGQDQRVLAACPAGKKLASDVEVDASGSGRTAELPSERAAVVRDVARRTAICGGHLRVSIFSASSAATVVLYDGELSLPGATDNARLRRVPELVDQVMTTTTRAYATKVNDLTPDGSDIVAQYRLGSEYVQQLGDGYILRLVLLTDGFQASSAFGIGDQPLSADEAAALAEQVTVPSLPTNASVTVAGLGKVVGQPPASAVVDGLIAFYDAICHRAGAGTCLSVTDYTSAGR